MPSTILYVQSTSEIGGSDISLVRLLQRLDRTRFRPVVILPGDGPLVTEYRRQGCEVHLIAEMKKLTSRLGLSYLARFAANYPRAARRLARIVESEGAAIVHTNTLHNWYGAGAAWLAGRPHVWHVREIVWQSHLLLAFERFLVRHLADRVIVTSDAVGDALAGGDSRLRHKMLKISNGVDVDRFRPGLRSHELHDDLGIDRGRPLVGQVCRLDRWKGVETFIDAAALCRAGGSDAGYVIIGGPIEGHVGYEAELRSRVSALGLDGFVYFTGWRYGPDEMPDIYASLAAVVVASRRPEPFGLVVLEAMAAGKPVVATNHGGPREICVDGETGLLVPPDNPQEMARALLSLREDPERACAMGRAGRRRVEAHFEQQRTVEQIEALYDELLRES